MSNWQEMFDKRVSGNRASVHSEGETLELEESDAGERPDPARYEPWILQRGRRPAMFLDLRRFEPRTGTPIGCQMSYPYLAAVDYIGDHMVALDFGTRHFVVEGKGLDRLVARLQQGMVLAIQEYSSHVWPDDGLEGPAVKKIIETRFDDRIKTR